MSSTIMQQIIDFLHQKYPNPKPSLNFTGVFDFLVAVMLSAQCTDVRVNKTTPLLFPKYDSPEKMLILGETKLREIIKPCGFFNTKAANIIKLSELLVAKYNGEVPDNMEELVSLPGVGRKTASVVLSQFFNKYAFPVDTHVFRVANRLGITKSKNPVETERQICKKVDKKYWHDLHLQLIFHGREICKARKPLCQICPLASICQYKMKNLL